MGTLTARIKNDSAVRVSLSCKLSPDIFLQPFSYLGSARRVFIVSTFYLLGGCPFYGRPLSVMQYPTRESSPSDSVVVDSVPVNGDVT